MNTFYHGDCLFVMKHDIDSDSIDLIYLDPPFFTGKVQKGTMKWQPGAMEISYQDSKRFWSEKADVMREKAPGWLRYVAIKRPDFASYLWYMMERLQACNTVLKKTGSIYLHCDYRASHYLKMVMDEVFGYRNFRNEIVWHYTSGGASKSGFAKKHDTLFFYSKSDQYYFKQQKYKRFLDKSKGYDPRIEYFKDKESGRDYRVNIMPDVWTDIGIISPNSFERLGYPTQKPEPLLERIINVSSNEGDLLLDPFCGCGTAVIVASKLNRKFIGIDIDTSKRKPGKLPTAFIVIKNRSHELFAQAQYVTRDLSEVLEMNPKQFEDWVNEFYKATKPHPDRGVDGITHEGIPIQVKTFQIKYDTIDKLLSSSKFHPSVPKPIKKLIFASQVGFDDGARKRKFEIETTDGIEVILVTPEDMLKLD
jgi:site-specific DNA-methyltransferase (adenine-specific)